MGKHSSYFVNIEEGRVEVYDTRDRKHTFDLDDYGKLRLQRFFARRRIRSVRTSSSVDFAHEYGVRGGGGKTAAQRVHEFLSEALAWTLDRDREVRAYVMDKEDLEGLRSPAAKRALGFGLAGKGAGMNLDLTVTEAEQLVRHLQAAIAEVEARVAAGTLPDVL